VGLRQLERRICIAKVIGETPDQLLLNVVWLFQELRGIPLSIRNDRIPDVVVAVSLRMSYLVLRPPAAPESVKMTPNVCCDDV
jgi:hypothetical protein